MSNAGTKWIAVGVLLLLHAGGCSRSPKSKDLAALEQAYRSGVLNHGDYEEKKAALESQADALGTLDKALAAGAISPADYEAMKTRLLVRGTALASLERARRAGVFTQEEYTAKKATLLAADAASSPPSPLAAISPLSLPAISAGGTSTADTNPVATPVAFQKKSPEPETGSAEAQNHVLRMKMVSAIDQYGFERPMPSLSMLVPSDWQSQGGTTWNIKDKCNTIQTSLRSSGPDGRALEFFPAFNWVWADDPKPLQMTAAQTARFGSRPCDVTPPLSATEYLRRNLNRYRPNAQVIGFEPTPKLLATLQQQALQGEQSAARYNLKQSIRPDAVKARVRYSLNGQAMEEWIIVATITTGTLGPSYNTQTMQMGQAYTYNCIAYVTAERAAQGQLDASAKFFELLVGTSRVNPAWQAKVSGNAQAMQQIELKGVRDRSAIVTKNAEEVSAIRGQGYENAQRSQDQILFENSQNMRGVERYRNPATGETVDLSNQYGQALVNNRGEYLLSDQPGFDPSATFKEDWKALEKVK